MNACGQANKLMKCTCASHIMAANSILLSGRVSKVKHFLAFLFYWIL